MAGRILTISPVQNTRKVTLYKYCKEGLAHGAKYPLIPTDQPAILVEHHGELPPIPNESREVKMTPQILSSIPNKKQTIRGKIAVYVAGHSFMTQKTLHNEPMPPAQKVNFDVFTALEWFAQRMDEPDGVEVLYGADNVGSLFEPAKKNNLCWSINNMDSSLKQVNNRYGDTSVYGHVGGKVGFIYLGRKRSLSPWHEEDGAAFSTNVVHSGYPKLWMALARKDFLRARKLIRQAAKGELIGNLICCSNSTMYSYNVS